MPVTQPAGAVRSIGATNVRDVKFSPDGSRLYETSGNSLTAYDVATGATVGNWTIGTSLGAIDVSNDGRYVLAVEQQGGPGSGDQWDHAQDFYVYRLDTVTGRAATYTSHVTGYDRAYYDVSYLADGTALLSQTFAGSGQPGVTTLDLSTGVFTKASGYSLTQNDTLTATADDKTILIGEQNISDAEMALYATGQGIIRTHGSYADGVEGFNGGTQAIAGDGSLIVQGVGMTVYDGNLKFKLHLTDLYPNLNADGLALSANGDTLYVLNGYVQPNGYAQTITAIGTAHWDVIATYPIGTSAFNTPGSAAISYGDSLQISADGHYLAATTLGQTRLIDLATAVSDSTTGHGHVVTGTGANDVLHGHYGNDMVDGDAGDDTLVYAGLYHDYMPAMHDGGWTVSGGREGGIDTLMSIETLWFADGSLTTDPTSNAAAVMRLYDTALHRVPDASGLDYWVGQMAHGTTSLGDVATAFLNSTEFQAATGGLSDDAYVAFLYTSALGRAADAGGEAYWMDQLAHGATRAELLAGFSESGEHKGLTAAQLAGGLFVTDTDYKEVASLYDAAVGREPDMAGLTYWAGQIKSGVMTLGQVADGVAVSAEFQAEIGGKSNAAIVETMYENTLHRHGDAAGIAYWTGLLDHGLSEGQLLLGFSDSAEHYQLIASHITGGIDYLS